MYKYVRKYYNQNWVAMRWPASRVPIAPKRSDWAISYASPMLLTIDFICKGLY